MECCHFVFVANISSTSFNAHVPTNMITCAVEVVKNIFVNSDNMAQINFSDNL